MSGILFLDPGINETGWAIVYGKTLEASGVISGGKNKAIRMQTISLAVEGLLRTEDVGLCVCEVTEGFSYRRSQGKNHRALMTNDQVVSGIKMACFRWEVGCVEVGATVWRGYMDKETSKLLARVENHNQADAINLGRWWVNIGHKLPGDVLLGKRGGRRVR